MAKNVRQRDVLQRLVQDPALPTPPALALQVLERAGRPDCILADLGKIIRMDPGLSGSILRVVNSALFSLSKPVVSIERALSLLGLKRVRSLVLSFSLPAMQRPETFDRRAVTYWKTSVAGARVAQALAAKRKKSDPEDDLIAGLLRGVGELVLRQAYPGKYAELETHTPAELATARCEIEEALFGYNHAEVGADLLRRWHLPEDMTEAIRHHCRPERGCGLKPPVLERMYVLSFAGRAAELELAVCPAELRDELFSLGRDHLGMQPEEVENFLESIGDEIRHLVSLLDAEPASGNCGPVLSRAMEELMRLTIELSHDHLRTGHEKAQVQEEVQRWKREASRDPLTGLFNRGFLEETLAGELSRSRRRGDGLGLLFIDLDGFKPLNDRFGHLLGDQVLREVAAALRRNVRAGDTVARFGGDEFCVIASPATPVGLETLAQRIRRAINDLKVQEAGGQPVGACIGAVFCSPLETPGTPVDLLEAADKAMYAAKMAGKNRVHVVRYVVR